MRVRMLAHISGTRDGQHWPPVGGEITVPDAEGAELCAAGIAVPVAEIAVERAVAAPAERRARTRKVSGDDN